MRIDISDLIRSISLMLTRQARMKGGPEACKVTPEGLLTALSSFQDVTEMSQSRILASHLSSSMVRLSDVLHVARSISPGSSCFVTHSVALAEML